jgi:hypothetical protein
VGGFTCEEYTAVDGTGFARVRGQARSHKDLRQLLEIEHDSCTHKSMSTQAKKTRLAPGFLRLARSITSWNGL